MSRIAVCPVRAFLAVLVLLSATMAAEDTNEIGQLDAEILRCTEILKKSPRNVDAYIRRGRAWHEKKEYDKAIDDFNSAQRLDPKNPTIYYNRGNVRSSRAHYAKAIIDYTEALRLDPKDKASYCNRGIAWFETHEDGLAIADFGKAIALNPKDAVAYLNRGNVSLRNRDDERAIGDYTKSVEINPNYSDAYVNRGVCFKRKREYEKAIGDYRSAMRIDPDSVAAHHNSAWFWATFPDRRFRDGKRAVEAATRACEITKWRDAEELGVLAAAFAEAGDFAKALEWQEKANTLYTEADDREDGAERLKLYKKRVPFRDDQ